MGDHFWPSIYPGIAVGVFYGIWRGGLWSILLGALGGLCASYLAFTAFGSFFGQDGLLPLLVLLALCLIGAAAVERAARPLLPSGSKV